MIYRVYVEFKPGILDWSEAIKNSKSARFSNVENISKGKFFDIELSSNNCLSISKK